MNPKNVSISFYFHKAVYYTGFGIAVLFALSFFWPVLFTVALLLELFIVIALLTDIILLFSYTKGFSAKRHLPERLSNGDENKINITLYNHYPFAAACTIIDELPYQFQLRSWQRIIRLDKGEKGNIEYVLKPVVRGEYDFGAINVYVSGPLRLVQRRFIFKENKKVKVYPSFVQMKRYQLLAIGNKLSEAGTKKVRRLGHSMEFEQIKEYVRGDDYRTINWKATARHGNLMVNNFTDERSQQIFCLINKSRTMKMPFGGMTLLDYAINASLVLLNTALHKQDKAGLITFAENVDTFIAADKKPAQLNTMLEALYQQQTHFLEPDLEKLFSAVRNRITQRSLLVLFTNFETVESLQRDLPMLKRLAHYHLLMVVFFENTELQALIEKKPHTTEEIYIKTIAQKYQHEKKRMVKELHQHGIIAILSPPQKLTVNTLNKYLELKNRQSI